MAHHSMSVRDPKSHVQAWLSDTLGLPNSPQFGCTDSAERTGKMPSRRKLPVTRLVDHYAFWRITNAIWSATC